jgi:Icc-related predicted phosphoesterase
MGNHEHYSGDYAKTLQHLQNFFEHIPNLHILEKELIKIDDITFICGTMWTDMNNKDALTLYQIKNSMNDFACIKNSNRMIGGIRPATFTPEDSVHAHSDFMKFARAALADLTNDKVIMVTHHSPSRQTIHERYKNESIMNGAYVTDLDNFIIDNPQIKAWFFGHQHNRVDIKIGDTRVINNSRGYIGYEHCAQTFELKYIEV